MKETEKVWIKEPAKFDDMVSFLNWFDTTDSVDETVQRADRDWKERITNFKGFKSMRKKVCLEIGFGGGRLIVPASKDFETVMGIDIHSAFKKTGNFLRFQEVNNYILFSRNDVFDMPSEYVDFVYSFISFQHFANFSEVIIYLYEIKRILNSKGYAHIFFGKCWTGEEIRQENPTEIHKNKINLFIEPSVFYGSVEIIGFEIIEKEDKMARNLDKPLKMGNESNQARVLFRKKKLI